MTTLIDLAKETGRTRSHVRKVALAIGPLTWARHLCDNGHHQLVRAVNEEVAGKVRAKLLHGLCPDCGANMSTNGYCGVCNPEAQ